MSVKSSISLTESQDAYARSLVEAGHYSSLSAVLQQGLELLRERSETEALETDALRTLLEDRRKGPFISSEEMSGRLDGMLERKRRALGLDS